MVRLQDNKETDGIVGVVEIAQSIQCNSADAELAVSVTIHVALQSLGPSPIGNLAHLVIGQCGRVFAFNIADKGEIAEQFVWAIHAFDHSDGGDGQYAVSVAPGD